MSAEIESLRPALTVILDDGDFLINSVGPVGKAMLQAILPLAAAAKKVTVISDGDMKVMKRNGTGAENVAASKSAEKSAPARQKAAAFAGESLEPPPDVQDQFVSDLGSGATGERATGEHPTPTPGPNDPVAVPEPPAKPAKRAPRIFQDAAAPPAPELAEAEMSRILAEAAQAEQDAVRVAEDRRFQAQQAVQAGEDPAEVVAAEDAVSQPRRRTRERTLATTGRPCGRCAGNGQIVGDAGFAGACPVCHGQGQVKTWDRALKIR